jgi:hypothetical protein
MDIDAAEYKALSRALRSLLHNRELLPKVERRLDQAEARLKASLLTQEEGPMQVGPYHLRLTAAGEVATEYVGGDDGWEQLVIDEWEEL